MLNPQQGVATPTSQPPRRAMASRTLSGSSAPSTNGPPSASVTRCSAGGTPVASNSADWSDATLVPSATSTVYLSMRSRESGNSGNTVLYACHRHVLLPSGGMRERGKLELREHGVDPVVRGELLPFQSTQRTASALTCRRRAARQRRLSSWARWRSRCVRTSLVERTKR
jgi:hypothetical protein